VLALSALGYSNREIGVLLYVSTETVKTHLKHISQILGTRGKTHSVYAAMRLGLLGTTSRKSSFAPSQGSALTSGSEWNGSPEDLWNILSRDSHAA
jgi:hypothetical protein